MVILWLSYGKGCTGEAKCWYFGTILYVLLDEEGNIFARKFAENLHI
jgi:hypothetical protein